MRILGSPFEAALLLLLEMLMPTKTKTKTKRTARGAPKKAKRTTLQKTIDKMLAEQFILLVKPLSKVTAKREVPWWPMTNGVLDAVTVRVEVEDGDVFVDGWTAGIDRTQAMPRRFLRSAEGAWCEMQELARKNWCFVHVPRSTVEVKPEPVGEL